jgi:hypothetical protein
MERNVYPLFWIYHYSRSAEGEILSDFLWGLYRRRISPRASSTQIAFLLRTERETDGYYRLSLLEGLFCYERTLEGSNYRFLWFKF